MARTLKLTIAYDGTDFVGWQRQANGRSVQAVIEDALLPLEGTRVVITGAGRTDAGVHAAGQVASLTLGPPMRCDELLRALNATIGEDVRILAIDEAPDGFNAQFAARRKTYRYRIWYGGVVPPALRHFVWHVPQPLNIDAMNAAAGILLGVHDFAAFQAAGSDVRTTSRELEISNVSRIRPDDTTLGIGTRQTGDLLVYEIAGTGFLRHMVRNIVGTLADVGRGRRSVGDMRAILESRDRAQASATAPPHGLILWSVEY